MLVIGGLLVFLVAVGLTIVPSLATILPMAAIVDILGNDYLIIAGAGIIAFLAVVVMGMRRAATGITQATPPDPEGVQRAPQVGRSFNRRLAEPFEVPSLLTGRSRSEIRHRLREAAIKAVSRSRGAPRDAARETVQAGQWTTDATAAGFLERPPAEPSIDQRIHAALRGDTWFQYAARQTAEALPEAAGIDIELGDDKPSRSAEGSGSEPAAGQVLEVKGGRT